MPKFFPEAGLENLVICVPGVGNREPFSAVVTARIPDLNWFDGGTQCFPLYLYEKDEQAADELISRASEGEVVGFYRRRSAITDAVLTEFRVSIPPEVKKEDIFYYVYGILHSTEYRARFSSNLTKMLPRIPFTKEPVDFWKFSQSGRDLAQWHLNYEAVEPFPLQEHAGFLTLDPRKDFLVQKMAFGKRDKQVDKSTIIYNSRLILAGIPLESYDYAVNGKSAIEWVMERFQVTVDKDSGIRNDPNDWAREHNQPRYILDLLKRIVRVSLETMKIVNSLPKLNERQRA